MPITLASDCGASLKLHSCINPLLSNPATCWGLGYSWLPHNMAAWCAAHTHTSIRERLPCAAAGWLSSWHQKRHRVKVWVEELTSVGNLILPSYSQHLHPHTSVPPATLTITTTTLFLFSKFGLAIFKRSPCPFLFPPRFFSNNKSAHMEQKLIFTSGPLEEVWFFKNANLNISNELPWAPVLVFN